MREKVKQYIDVAHSMGGLARDEYNGLLSKFEAFDFGLFGPLIDRAKQSRVPGLAQLAGALLAMIVAGYKPAVVSDFDRTFTPFSQNLAQTLRRILENKGRFGILSGNVKKVFETKCLDMPEFKVVFSGKMELLKEFHLFPKIASEHWAYNSTQNDYCLVDSTELALELGKRDGDGNVLPGHQWDPRRGRQHLQRYIGILKDMISVFDLAEGIPGYPVAGNLIVDLGSQMDVRVTGENSSDDARDAYANHEERDCKDRGIYLRELYAAYVNLQTGHFNPKRDRGDDILRELQKYLEERNAAMPVAPTIPEKRIPMIVRRAGRTNLEGVVVGMDKAWGLSKIAGVFGQPVWTIIYSGDEFEDGGNDFAVLDRASVLINVGAKIRESGVNHFLVTASETGPAGLIDYYQLIGDVLEMISNHLG